MQLESLSHWGLGKHSTRLVYGHCSNWLRWLDAWHPLLIGIPTKSVIYSKFGSHAKRTSLKPARTRSTQEVFGRYYLFGLPNTLLEQTFSIANRRVWTAPLWKKLTWKLKKLMVGKMHCPFGMPSFQLSCLISEVLCEPRKKTSWPYLSPAIFMTTWKIPS